MYDNDCHCGDDRDDDDDDDVAYFLHCYCLLSFPNDSRESITISRLLEYA